MSQEGILSATSSSPSIPTTFVTDVGSAVPALNVLNVLGSVVNAHSVPVQTLGVSNDVTITVQLAAAEASSNDLHAGLASFNSTDFTVDSNGFVSLVGGEAAVKFTVDTNTMPGTNPVIPDGTGNVTITGGQVAAGTTTNVIRTDSLAANTYTIQVQRSQAVASSTIGDNGVCHFDSADFTVDANGFVSAATTGFLKTLTGNSGGAVHPTSNNINVVTVPATDAGTANFSGSGSTLSLNFADAANNVVIGAPHFPHITSGSGNTGLGSSGVFGQLTSGNYNVFIGQNVGASVETGSANVSVGFDSFTNVNPGGSYNCMFGYAAGNSYTTTESDNILINSAGVNGESNVCRIGAATGTGTQQLNAAYFYGITGTTNTSAELVSINSSTAQLGVISSVNNAVLTSGTAGIPVLTALSSDGQLIIGSSAGAPAAAVLSAGTGISITNGHNSITIATTGTTVLTVTPLTHASSPYTVLSTDDFLAITGSVGSFTVKLPNAPTTGRVIIIKDSNGIANTDNILVTTVGGTVTIDGQTTYTMNVNYQSLSVIFDGSNYEVF